MSHLSQILEKKEKQREEQILSTVIEGEQVRVSALEYAGQEQKNRVTKKEQQSKMKQELDQLIQARREKQMEKERCLNMVEFSMNKNSLKQLGIFNKEGMD